MDANKNKMTDDVWSAPESGTDRDETTGNQPSDRFNKITAQDRANPGGHKQEKCEKDDPSFAQEEM